MARRPNLAPGVGPFPRCARGRAVRGTVKSGRIRPDRGVPGTLSVSGGGCMYSPACRVRVEDWMPTCGSPRACDIDTPDYEARLGERTPDKPGALATSRVDPIGGWVYTRQSAGSSRVRLTVGMGDWGSAYRVGGIPLGVSVGRRGLPRGSISRTPQRGVPGAGPGGPPGGPPGPPPGGGGHILEGI